MYGVPVKLLVLPLFGYEHVHVHVYIFVLYILYYLMYLLLILTWYWHIHLYCWIIQMFRCKVHCSVQSHFQLILLWSVIHIFFRFFFHQFYILHFCQFFSVKNQLFWNWKIMLVLSIFQTCLCERWFCSGEILINWRSQINLLQCYNATWVSWLILVNRARLDLIVYCCTYLFGEFVLILSLCYMFYQYIYKCLVHFSLLL